MAFGSFSHQKQDSTAAEVSVRGKGAFPLGGRLMPVHKPPHPFLIPTGFPQIFPEVNEILCQSSANNEF